MKINVIDDKGAERLVNIVTSFKLSGKKYIIYSFFEKDSAGSIRIYISELRIKQDSFSFNNILNDNEWEMVKKIMKEFAKGIGNLEYVLSNFDVEVVPFRDVMENNEYILATIKDSKVVKVSSKFIEGLVGTYKEMINLLEGLKLTNNKVLICVEELTENVCLAARNLANIKIVLPEEVNTYDLVCSDNLLITEKALNNLEEVLK